MNSSTETKRKHWGMVAALGFSVGLAWAGMVGCGPAEQSSDTCDCTASVNGIERTWACGGVQCLSGTKFLCSTQGVTQQGSCEAPSTEPSDAGTDPGTPDSDTTTPTHYCQDELAKHCDQCTGSFKTSCLERVQAGDDNACAYWWANASAYCR